MKSAFGKKKNRTAQAVMAGTAVAVTFVATGGLGLIAVGAASAAWWLTGKATAK